MLKQKANRGILRFFCNRIQGKFWEEFKKLMEESLPDHYLTKHLAERDLGRLEPTSSLKYQKAV